MPPVPRQPSAKKPTSAPVDRVARSDGRGEGREAGHASKPADAAAARRLSLAGAGFGNDLVLAGPILLVLVGFGLRRASASRPGSLVSIGQQTAVIAIVGFRRLTAVIIARGIDISVGSTLAIAGIVAGQAYAATGSPLLLGTSSRAPARGRAIELINGRLLIGAVGDRACSIATCRRRWRQKVAVLSSLRRLRRRSRSTAPYLLWAGSADILGGPGLAAAGGLAARRLVGAGGTASCSGAGSSRWSAAMPVLPEASLIPVRGNCADFDQASWAGMSAWARRCRSSSAGSARPCASSGRHLRPPEFAAHRLPPSSRRRPSCSAARAASAGTVPAHWPFPAPSLPALSFLQVPQQVIYIVTVGGLVLFAVLPEPARPLAAT